MKPENKFSLREFVTDIGYGLLYPLVWLLDFIIASVNGILDRRFGISLYHDRRLVEKHLLSTMGASKTALLKQALKRFNLHYEDMFYWAEDLTVYDRLDMYVEYKGANAFSSKENAIIKQATDCLNGASMDVKEQIIGFCIC